MKYNIFPGTAEKVSAIGLGTWVFGGENWGGADDDQCVMAFEQAVEQGINFIDTAAFYSNGRAEELIGSVIRGHRDKLFIATKCGLVRYEGRLRIELSPYSVFHECEMSLRRMHCDVIDLFQCHWPDDNTPVELTMEALVKLQKQLKIRHIGVCNFDSLLLEKAIKVAPVKTLQIHYSLLERSREENLIPFCIEKGIGVIAYGPMGGGILTGKYKEPPQLAKSDARSMFYKYYSGKKFEQIQSAVEKLKALGHPLNQVALNWVRQQKGVLTVLAGGRTPEQVALNAAATDWDLTAEELGKIKQIKF